MFWKAIFNAIFGKRGYHTYTGSEFYRWKGKKQNARKRIKTRLTQKGGLVFRSKAIENAIEKVLDSGKYTEEKMLVLKNPYMLSPLTALIIFTTKEPCSVHVILEDGDLLDQWTEVSTRHRIPVYGMHPGMENKIHLELWRDDQCQSEKVVSITTRKLPKFLLDQVVVQKKKKESVSPFTLVFGGSIRYPYAFDESGEIRFYIRRRTKSYGLYRLSEGRFLYLSNNVQVPSYANPHSALAMEMDLMGRVFREYMIQKGIHHDGCEMTPGGNILGLSSSLTDYVEDAVVEIDRNTGKVVKQLNLADILSEHPYFNFIDWAHLNTVSYQQEEHTVLLCARNLHSVFKIDWETDELLWIISDPFIWKGTPYEEKVLTPVGDDMGYCYQAHSSYFLPEDASDKKRMIIYDNHWAKRRPMETFDGDKKSYVRIYEIDEKEHTVTMQGNFATPKSTIRSIGLVIGDRVMAMSGALLKAKDGCKGRITEFDRESGKIINDYLTKNDFYRAYPFFADYAAMSRSMEETPQILRDDEAVDLKKCTSVKVGDMPLAIGSPNLNYKFYEDILLIKETDHEVEKIYFEGKKNAYVKDYTQTEQKWPEKFGDMVYFLPIPTLALEPDHYRIYLQFRGSLFDTKKTFRITE